MQFSRRLLMFSALFALVYSLPIETESENQRHLKNATEALNVTGSKRSTVVHVEEKTADPGSVVLELIFNGNNENSVNAKGRDKDKYIINPQENEVAGAKTNSKESTTLLSNQNIEKKHIAQGQTESKTELKPVTILKKTEITETKSSSTEENLPITETKKNYFYDDFYPVPPFPELDRRINPLNPVSVFDRELRRPSFDIGHFHRPLYI